MGVHNNGKGLKWSNLVILRQGWHSPPPMSITEFCFEKQLRKYRVVELRNLATSLFCHIFPYSQCILMENIVLIVWCLMPFSTYFSCTEEASAPIHAFLEFSWPVLCSIFFPNHWLLSHINIVKTMDSRERGMNPVAMTIINPWKDYWPSRRFKPATDLFSSLLTELWSTILKE